MVDSLWNEAAWKQRLVNHKTKRLPQLEQQRKEMLSPNWEPNDDWWGSEIETKD